jgi:DNA-binding transcriptional MerR regulator
MLDERGTNVLKIGDFSKLGSVTVKTLRHYAGLGLLKPAWIDRFSGYRYYSLHQLPRLNRILALKDLGFSLEQIAGLIEEDVPVKQLHEMLRRKQNELEARLRAEQNRLEWVAARLTQLERSGSPIESAAVLVRHSPALPVAYIHEIVPVANQLPARMEVLANELSAWLALRKLPAESPWMALHPSPEYRERDVPVEIAVQVAPGVVRQAVDAGGRVKLRTLMPATELACLVHTGPLETLGGAYTALYTWMEANRRRPCGPARELHLRDRQGDLPPDPSAQRPSGEKCSQAVEIQIPVEPITSEVERQTIERENNMQPKIITLPAFNVIGMCYHGDNQNQEIAAMWGEFNQRAQEVLRVAVPGSAAYGVCSMGIRGQRQCPRAAGDGAAAHISSQICRV